MSGSHEHYAGLLTEALTGPSAYAALTPEQVDRAVNQLATDLQLRYARCLWEHDRPELLTACLDAVGEFFHAFYDPDDVPLPETLGLYMFWDELNVEFVADYPDLHLRALRLLELQLASPARAMRESAAHGLGHLFSDGARQLLRDYAPRIEDDEERERVIYIAENGTS